MTAETYWLVAPIAFIGLSGVGWLALWLTRPRGRGDQHQTGGAGRHP
jgi:hypothetical protein